MSLVESEQVEPAVFQLEVTTAVPDGYPGGSGCWPDRQVGHTGEVIFGEASIDLANIRSRLGNPLGAVVVFVPTAGQSTIGIFPVSLVEPPNC